MAARAETFDLGRLSLSSGEGRWLELTVPVGEFSFAGQDYRAGETAVVLDVARTTHGYALRLRFEAALEGPCMRCLEPAGQRIGVDVREIDQPGDGDDDLSSPYVDGDELELAAWARDSLVLALPAQIVCRDECLGLCGVCGANLNEAGEDHRHEREPNPRWAALRELRLE